ncbi:hypothetical protein D9Q98_003644 [Chlorella vulgaris]|uniref:VASt domain-containing protein n=1 Tax=Chlorella vulgaris TaxID=3077 RepID=A0A9D4TTB2_CHLVU|nr:hypothetical protein D9Q98_003644 [Chlorella vulgaris]
MVKNVVVNVSVSGWAAQDLFDMVYNGNGAFLRSFHRHVNGDPDASVGEWEDDQRTVTFCTPVDAPGLIKRMLPQDTIQVVERQQRGCETDGSLTLTSTPVPVVPGAAMFTTRAVLTFNDSGNGECQIHAMVTCSASGPYGLIGTVESFMAEAGKKSLLQFLEAVKALVPGVQAVPPPLVAASVATGLPAPAAATIAAVPASSSFGPARVAAAGHAELPEQFYDAPELLLPPTPSSGGGQPEELDAAQLYLRYMCRTSDQTVGLLQALELQVRSLHDTVADLHRMVDEERRRRAWWPDLPHTVSTRGAVLGAMLLASSAAAAALMISRRQRTMAVA